MNLWKRYQYPIVFACLLSFAALALLLKAWYLWGIEVGAEGGKLVGKRNLLRDLEASHQERCEVNQECIKAGGFPAALVPGHKIVCQTVLSRPKKVTLKNREDIWCCLPVSDRDVQLSTSEYDLNSPNW
jgi:hypothetical protein